MSSIRILSSLKPGPEITLLITQADKLRSQGESIDDVEQIVNKHIPLISRRYKDLKKVLVSATEYNDEHIGILPLVSDLILNTNLYKIALPKKMEKLLSDLNSGKDVLVEFNRLKEVAKVFDFCSDTTKAFVATKGNLAESIQELNACVAEVSLIIGRTGSKKAQLRLLNEVKGRMRFERSQKYIDNKLKLIAESVSETQGIIIVIILIAAFSLFAILFGVLSSSL
jgi:hypothetical protein